MGRRKKILVGKVISVRVSDHGMESMRELMQTTQKSASTIMREAIKLFIVAAS